VSTAGQTMIEPEKSSYLGEVSAVMVRLGVGLPTMRLFSHLYSAVTQTPKVLEQLSAR